MEIKTLGTVATYINGRAFKPAEWEATGKQIIRIQNLTNKYAPYNYSTRMYEEKYLVHDGDLLFAWSASLGAHIWKGKDAWLNQHIFRVIPNVGINRDYLYYYLLTVVAELYAKTHGSGMVHITKAPFMNTPIPVPTLPEQERIVAHIEELFSQLDAGVETLKKTKAQLAVYRQAVLKEAFGSFLEKRPICEMSSIVTSGSRGWAKYYADKGARFIRITDLTRDRIGLKDDSIQYVDLPDNTEGKRSRLSADDVLISITADLGSIALVPQNIPEAYINQHIAVVRLKNPKQGKFMSWYLKSEYGQKDLLKNKRGGGKLGLGLDDIRDTPVPVVDNKTADVVVAQIDSRLSVCDSIEQTVDTALQQAEALRQSILKQVFEGELFDGTIQRI